MSKNNTSKFISTPTGKIQKAVDSSMRVEPRMLPAQFRRRSHWLQRLFMIIVVMLYSTAIGLIITTTMGGLDIAYQLTATSETNGSATYLLMSLMILSIMLLVSGVYIFWNRIRAFLISKSGFGMYAVPPTIVILGMTYISINTGTPHDLFNYIGYIGLALGIGVGGLMIARAIYHRRGFRDSLFRVIYTTPGLVIASLSPFALSIMLKDKPTSIVTIVPLAAIMGTAVIGGMILILGMALSTKYTPVGTKTLWKSVRFSGGLPTITIYTTLVAVAFTFAIGAEISTPLIFSLGFNFILLVGFLVFLFMRGRIKKINITNPIFNQIIFKSFVALVALSGLILTEALPGLNPEAKSFGPESYALLAISSLTIILGTGAAHILNLITFSKFFKTTISGMLFAVMLILVSVFTIATLKHAGVIFNILSRQIVVLFLSIATIIELLLLLGDAVYLIADIFSIKKSIKTKESELAAVEAEIKQEAKLQKSVSGTQGGR